MEGKLCTARELIKALRTLPPDMKVEFVPVSMAWLGSTRTQRAFQLAVYNERGNLPRKPFSKKCRACIYIGDEQP